MVDKPDAGRIVDQFAVAILPDERASEVFDKVTLAAEAVLARSIDALVAGTAVLRPQDLARGSYFGGRKPEDGRIDWNQPAAAIHNLVRAVAPPYPGAFSELRGRPWRILRTRIAPETAHESHPGVAVAPAIVVEPGRCRAVCGDHRALDLLEMELDGAAFTPRDFANLAGQGVFPLPYY
jgi:methionyl-tRNA formyltransferase